MHLDFSGNPEAQDLINLVNFSDNHVFLTGRAGTGKTSLMRSIQGQIQKRYIALASTGIAAVNISGKTIHSFFQFDIVPILPGDRVNYQYNQEKRQLISNLQVIIIDEVSMVRADTVDAIDRTLQFYRKSDQPFGGIQLILVGDSFQLPPIAQTSHWNVLKGTYQSLFFFDALVFRNCELLTVELIKVYRQQDPFFLKILDAIRLNQTKPELLSELNKRVTSSSTEVKGMVTLATTKDIVANINNEKLATLPGKSKQYKGVIEGSFKSLPTLQSLELKKGAQIMMVKNDNQSRWVNGSTGIITELHEQQISIKLDLGAELDILAHVDPPVMVSYFGLR